MKGNKPEKTGLMGNWIVKNLVLAALLVIALILVANIVLYVFTRHGNEIEVPDFTNMTYTEAADLASNSGVKVVVSDSVYVRQMRKGAVYNQFPKAGQKIKPGRHIMLTTNSRTPKKEPMPSLVGLSMHEAKTVIASKGLVLGRLTYVQDIATNIVIRQQYKGRDITPGTMIKSGSVINLVVGLNPSEHSTYVPDLKGIKYMRAIEYIHDNSLNLGKVTFDKSVKTYNDTINSIVWKQSPASRREPYTMGTDVSIFLTVDPEKLKK